MNVIKGLKQFTKRSYGTMLACTSLAATDESSLWDVIMRMFKIFGLRQFAKRSYGMMLASINLVATDEPSPLGR